MNSEISSGLFFPSPDSLEFLSLESLDLRLLKTDLGECISLFSLTRGDNLGDVTIILKAL